MWECDLLHTCQTQGVHCDVASPVHPHPSPANLQLTNFEITYSELFSGSRFELFCWIRQFSSKPNCNVHTRSQKIVLTEIHTGSRRILVLSRKLFCLVRTWPVCWTLSCPIFAIKGLTVSQPDFDIKILSDRHAWRRWKIRAPCESSEQDTGMGANIPFEGGRIGARIWSWSSNLTNFPVRTSIEFQPSANENHQGMCISNHLFPLLLCSREHVSPNFSWPCERLHT